MAITEFSSRRPDRPLIGLFGEDLVPSAEQAFADRGYKLAVVSEQELSTPSKYSVLDSVVVRQDPDKPGAVRDWLTSYARPLLAADVRIYIRLADEKLHKSGRPFMLNMLAALGLPATVLSNEERNSYPQMQFEREGAALPPYVYVCGSAFDWRSIAEIISENPAGKAPNLQLQIDARNEKGEEVGLTAEQRSLLQRAFHDCKIVHLIPMADGLSGVAPFRAYAELAAGQLGAEPYPWPYPYFVKLGKRGKVVAEYDRYVWKAAEYIPFFLAPRLRLERCGLGAADGIVVTDLVEGAESLRDCARDGRAVQAIANLFAKSLRSWWIVAKEEARSVPEQLHSLKLFPDKIPDGRAKVAKDLGGTMSLEQLRAKFDACAAGPVLTGPIHCDLHAANILVRGSDAILIDFEKATSGPLVYDAACLEAGLFVDGFIGDRRSPAQILQSILSLYEEPLLVSKHCHPRDASSWYYDCVKQIRLYAHRAERGRDQYAAALALAFIKKACNDHPFPPERAALRASGLVIAETILERT